MSTCVFAGQGAGAAAGGPSCTSKRSRRCDCGAGDGCFSAPGVLQTISSSSSSAARHLAGVRIKTIKCEKNKVWVNFRVFLYTFEPKTISSSYRSYENLDCTMKFIIVTGYNATSYDRKLHQILCQIEGLNFIHYSFSTLFILTCAQPVDSHTAQWLLSLTRYRFLSSLETIKHKKIVLNLTYGVQITHRDGSL